MSENKFNNDSTFNKKLTKKLKCIIPKKEYELIKFSLKEKKRQYDECIKSKYKYGDKNINLLELLNIIKKENKQNVLDIIELFPFIGMKNIKVTQSHVFEAIWFLIFFMGYDNLLNDDIKRIFYKRLEENSIEDENLKDILKSTNVNESHKSGIADIYFKHVAKKSSKKEKKN